MTQNHSCTEHTFRRLYQTALLLLPIFAALIAGGFYMAMTFDFDVSIGHFRAPSAGFLLFTAGIVLALLLSGSLYIFSRRAVSLHGSPADHPLQIFGAILTALLAVIGLLAGADQLAVMPDASLPRKIAVVLLPFLAVSMLLTLFPRQRYTHIRQAAALLAVLSVNLVLFADYFQFDLPLNSPIRNLLMLSKCAALLHLLSEAQLSFGAPCGDAASAGPKKFSLPFALLTDGLAASVTLGFSAGALVYALLNPSPAHLLPSVYTLALYTALGLHAFGRLWQMRPLLGPYEAPAVSGNTSGDTRDKQPPEEAEKADISST